MNRVLPGLFVVLPAVIDGATLIVDPAGAGDFRTIQPALDWARNGDTVLVRPGEYFITEPLDFNRLRRPDDPARPPVKDLVLRSEGGPAVTAIRMSGAPAHPDRWSVAVFLSGETRASVISGFLITGGKGTRVGCCSLGGGVLCFNGSSPTIADCTIAGNTASQGGGVHCEERSSPAILDCSIRGNAAAGSGGGVLCAERSSPTILRSTIVRNSARIAGGGLAASRSSPRLTGCRISDNAADDGGGVYLEERSSAVLESCTISANTGGVGGGVSCEDSSATFSACDISGNAAQLGGGVYSEDRLSPTFLNCTITGNTAHFGCGGGLHALEDSSPILKNCTITGNAAAESCGSGIHCEENSSATLVDSIVWANGNSSISRDEDSFALASFSCIEGREVWPGSGNINGDPLFRTSGHWEECDAGSQEGCVPYRLDENRKPTAWRRWVPGDYRLRPGSPCLDTGSTAGAPTTDLEGRTRPCGAGVDIGAYESGDCAPPVKFRRGDVDAGGDLDLSDPILLLNHLFAGAPAPPCGDAADADDDAALALTDAVYLLNFQFLGGDPPKNPFPSCGIDGLIDVLDCGAFPGCR